MKRVCVYCGSSAGAREEYTAAAQQLGAAIARRGLVLVFGGGKVGLMGEVADAALAEGGEVIGVLPRIFAGKVSHEGLSKLHIVDSLHERKALMIDLSDAFIALPGGMGTMEELFEVLAWLQIGLHSKPCGLLNTCDYYTALLQFLDHSVAEGFVKQAHRAMLLVDDEPDRLLDQLSTFQPRRVPKVAELE